MDTTPPPGECHSQSGFAAAALPSAAPSDYEYDVALSLAGEDREYVSAVAKHLRSKGVSVFYDEFETVRLWGKPLHEYLDAIFQYQARYMVPFISQSYVTSYWTAHELRSGQVRAWGQRDGYILPAYFDESVTVPALEGISRVVLSQYTPEDFADLIIDKLGKRRAHRDGAASSYSQAARADVNFPVAVSTPVTDIIVDLKSVQWPRQNDAVLRIPKLNWTEITSDQAFVLGRNVYQSACSNAREAEKWLGDLRQQLAGLPSQIACDLLNGMFFEVYFDSHATFRAANIKDQHLHRLLDLQTVPTYAPSIHFIRTELAPYRSRLPFLPATQPEHIRVELEVDRQSPPNITSLTLRGRSLLERTDPHESSLLHAWRRSRSEMTVSELQARLVRAWHVESDRVWIRCPPGINADTIVRLSERHILSAGNS